MRYGPSEMSSSMGNRRIRMAIGYKEEAETFLCHLN
jgi:hypothetical protein